MAQVLAEPVPFVRPGKAQVYLRPGPNARLRGAINIYGRPIYPTGSGSAGRTKAQQEHYWALYQAGGNVAANPYWGRRPHMRFAAVDIDDYNARGAMLAAGFVATTASEWWHFEDPDMYQSRFFAFAGWPVVTSFYLASSVLQEDTTTMILIRRDGSATKEWSLFFPGARGATDIERGYIKITNEIVARDLGRLLNDGGGREKGEQPPEYRSLQESARAVYDIQFGATPPTVPGSLDEVLQRLDKLELAVNRERKIV